MLLRFVTSSFHLALADSEVFLRTGAQRIKRYVSTGSLKIRARCKVQMKRLWRPEAKPQGSLNRTAATRKRYLWRPEAESNRRMEVLQTSALPLCYPAPLDSGMLFVIGIA